MTFLNAMTWYSLHYKFPLAYAKSSDQQNFVLKSLTYLPQNLVTVKLYTHGLGICSLPTNLLDLLGFFLILLFDQSQWSLFFFNLLNLH